MNKLRRIGVALSTLSLLTVPAFASAQWSLGLQRAQQSGLPQAPVTIIIQNTMNWILAVLGFFAIIAFVISGIMYLTSAGDEGQIDRAKTGMKYSIIGVIVALMGFVIVRAIDAWLNASQVF